MAGNICQSSQPRSRTSRRCCDPSQLQRPSGDLRLRAGSKSVFSLEWGSCQLQVTIAIAIEDSARRHPLHSDPCFQIKILANEEVHRKRANPKRWLQCANRHCLPSRIGLGGSATAGRSPWAEPGGAGRPCSSPRELTAVIPLLLLQRATLPLCRRVSDTFPHR
jgi:hypothetical protein